MFKIGCACAKTVSNQETEEDEDETDDLKVPPKKSGCWQSWELMVKLYAHVAILGNFLKDQGAEILGTANDINKAYRSIALETDYYWALLKIIFLFIPFFVRLFSNFLGVVFLRKDQKDKSIKDETLFTHWIINELPLWVKQLPIIQTLVNIAYFRQIELKNTQIKLIIAEYKNSTEETPKLWKCVTQMNSLNLEKWEKTNTKVRQCCTKYQRIKAEIEELERQQTEMDLVNSFGTAVPSFLLDFYILLLNGHPIGTSVSYKQGLFLVQKLELLPRFFQFLSASTSAYVMFSKYQHSLLDTIKVNFCFLFIIITRTFTVAVMLAYLKLWALIPLSIYFMVAHYKLSSYFEDHNFWTPFGIVATFVCPSFDFGRHSKYFFHSNHIATTFHIIQLLILLLTINVFELLRIYGDVSYNYFDGINYFNENDTKPSILHCLYPDGMEKETTRFSNCLWNGGNVSCLSLTELNKTVAEAFKDDDDDDEETEEYVTVCATKFKNTPFLSQWILLLICCVLIALLFQNSPLIYYLRNRQYNLTTWQVCYRLPTWIRLCDAEWISKNEGFLKVMRPFQNYFATSNCFINSSKLEKLFYEADTEMKEQLNKSFLQWLYEEHEVVYAHQILKIVKGIPIDEKILTAVSSTYAMRELRIIEFYVHGKYPKMLQEELPQCQQCCLISHCCSSCHQTRDSSEDEKDGEGVNYPEEKIQLLRIESMEHGTKVSSKPVAIIESQNLDWIGKLFNPENYHILWAMNEAKTLGNYYRFLHKKYNDYLWRKHDKQRFHWLIKYQDQYKDPLLKILDQLQSEANTTDQSNDIVRNYLYFFDVKSENNSSRIKKTFAKGKTLLDCPRAEYLIESKQIKQFEGVFKRGKDGKCTIDRKSHTSKSPFSMRFLKMLDERCQELQCSPHVEPVFIAARMGLIGNLKWMKSKQVCLLNSNANGFTTLHAAAENAQFEAFQLIAGDALNKNPADKRGITPLHIAADKGHIQLVQWLLQWILDNNEDPNPRSTNGDTPLHKACASGQLEAVKIIIAQIKDLNPKGRKDKPLLNIASIAGNYGCLDWLLAQIEMSNDQQQKETQPPIKSQIKPFKKDQSYLSKIGTFVYLDVDSEEKGYLPIHEACKTGNLKTARRIVKHMLKMGMTTINATSDDGTTPLHLAAKANKFQLVSWLFSQEEFQMTNLDAKDHNGFTAFDYALGFNSTREAGLIAEKAKEYGIDLFQTDEDRKRPLMIAATHGHIRCVKMLLDHQNDRYNPECSDKICKDPDFIELVMVMTLIYGFLEPAEYLFQYNGGTVRNPLLREVGYTPLHFAVRGRYLDVIEWLKQDTNLKSGPMQSIKTQSTPLHDACKLGYADIVAMLVDVIDIHLYDTHAKTAMDYAIEFRQEACQKALKSQEFATEPYVQYSVMESAICSQNLPLVKWLLAESEDLLKEFTPKCSYGLTPLQWALVKKREAPDNSTIAEEIVQELASKLNIGINKNVKIQIPFKYTVQDQLEN